MSPGPVTLAKVVAGDFLPLVGEQFAVSDSEGGDTITHFILSSADKRRPEQPGERPFSLVFDGPLDPAFDQGITWLHHSALGPLPIFIVPIAQDANGRSYEAVFN